MTVPDTLLPHVPAVQCPVSLCSPPTSALFTVGFTDSKPRVVRAPRALRRAYKVTTSRFSSCQLSLCLFSGRCQHGKCLFFVCQEH
ncbi:Protein of unknown function [Pyronema omphalodes CBS 100304]|uniref:Uncharacterized protein n=1 Tax=Pyronema omphalodes (strain CBS 100304) TaxID=1076935 RepID=U4LHN9_PYROM|nr:Protein of unknown function [Pyronema omphalodes CBS 100304]